MLLIHQADFKHQQLAPSVGNLNEKAMAPSRKAVSTVESSEDHSLHEQIAEMMATVETSAQQVLAANKALEEARAEFTAKIAELQLENQYLKETHKKNAVRSVQSGD